MKERVIAVFDIGKTNKKIILFNEKMKMVYEEEKQFTEVKDDDGFECDDIDLIEKWIHSRLEELAASDRYDLTDVNITTYGATIVCLDETGKRITPAYNYLKPLDDAIPESIYKRFGGRDEFCRRTASPALGMLNSGIQLLWMKKLKPDLFSRVRHVLHLPQYLTYTITGKICSEHTSIGCHTALWDFDNMAYHKWTESLGLKLPDTVPVNTVTEKTIAGKKIRIGVGIHDSSSSLTPYLKASSDNFILLSTGTWCINMNPFNYEKLTAEQLDKDCLCYMSINRQPVKSSRVFLGHIHETAVKMISDHFGMSENHYKTLKFKKDLSDSLREKYGEKSIFFQEQPFDRELRERIDFYEFRNFEIAYHQLMHELVRLTIKSIKLILKTPDDTSILYIAGGFSKNDHFINLIKCHFSDKKVFRSEISNSSALGAALVVSGLRPEMNLGLIECANIL